MTAPAVEYEQLLAAAAPYLHLRHPGHANQKVHGHRHGMSAEQFDDRVKGALDDTIDINDHTYHSMSSEGGRSLNDYSHGDSFSINDSLRQSKGSISDIKSGYVRESAAGVDKAFGEVKKTERDIVVTRGVQDIEATFAGHDPKAGLAWVDHGYVSTSSRSAGQNDMYHGEAGAQMRILVPKGTRAVSNENLEPDEIVLDRGYTFRVVRDRGVDFDGIRQLDVEVIPAMPGTRAAGDAGRGWQVRRRAGSTLLDQVVDRLPTPVEIIDESELPVRSGYGTVAVTGDAWLRERAQQILTDGLPHLRHLSGKHDQSSHGRGGGVRPALKKAKTIKEINAAGAAEAKRITGRDVHVDLTGSDPQIAREHLEGVLRGMQRYPEAPVSRVVSYGPDSAIGDMPGKEAGLAFTSRGGALKNPQPTDMIAFNNAAAKNPRGYYENGTQAQRSNFTVRGGPIANGVHEFGHSVAGPTVANSETRVRDVAARTKPAGKTLKEHVEKKVSVYAATDHRELAAEAFADSIMNGARASRVSRDIMAMIDDDYRQATT